MSPLREPSARSPKLPAPAAWLLLGAGLASSGCYQHARRDAPAAPPPKLSADMVSIPPATFTQGDINGEPDEYPERQVTVGAYKLQRMEVTNAEYRACVEARACDPGDYAEDEVLGKDDHPVVGVSWEDARNYCVWIGRRLPSEAEWEHAARGPDLRKWPWEGRFEPQRANTKSADDFHPMTAPVSAYPDGASPYGVLNLAGNVAEWVADYYDPTFYRGTEAERNPEGPDRGRERVVRGGSFADTAYLVRVSARRGKLPTDVDNTIGFRCAGND